MYRKDLGTNYYPCSVLLLWLVGRADEVRRKEKRFGIKVGLVELNHSFYYSRTLFLFHYLCTGFK